MGVSKEQAAENRLAIIAAAKQLFRERGVDAVGLSELMKHAGFTQGGFYNHFESKAALVAEVVASAMVDGATDFAQALKAPVVDSTTSLQRYVEYYLSPGHRDNIDYGCPVSGFAGDAPRIGAEAQSNFADGLDDQITLVAGLIAENGAADLAGQRRTLRERAISLHCQMVGALILSRSVTQAAPVLSEEILKNVLRDVSASIDPLSNPASAKAKKPRRSVVARH
ncbi:TetR/AcrR family transcriptional regulator [Bradyrhizobium genosp. P]|uniref:TetR/AcrR family transcriptional regulator n=1 Tax=Bradyrhizobium genosp. P TaxID=83641 RepID=UPI003CF6D0A8